MKRFLLFTFLIPVFVACNKATSPKETAEQYVKALSASDLTTVSSLTSADTRAVLDRANKEAKNTTTPEESFQFSSLAETINNNKAEVKNEIIAIPLIKEDDGWKVVLNESLLNEIQSRDQMLATAKAKWEALQKEYEARLQVLKDYTTYKKGMGTLSPKVALLSEALSKFPKQTNWTKESLLAYAEKQHQLNSLIDGALEPTRSANADLSLNYILQISAAADRIKSAENEYRTVAEKTHSPVFVPLPVYQQTLVQGNGK